MRAVLIANRSDADPGFVGQSLRARGYSFTEFIREDYAKWPSVAGFDLVVSLGSSWSTYWDEVADAVQTEQRLIANAIDRGIGILGICFGAQQLAMVMGGEVTKAQSAEIGWHQVFPVAEASHDLPAALTAGPWMQWHSDHFSVPSGATVLADSPIGPQVMVCGRALGLQFHPEVTESIIRTWTRDGGLEELAEHGVDPGELLGETIRNLESARQRCDEVVEWFVNEIAQKHEPPTKCHIV
jgi:GMP synthase-like glutamine amidotransferase